MLERCVQIVDGAMAHLRRVADSKGDPARRAAAAALGREAMLGRIHYFRVRDHVEQVGSRMEDMESRKRKKDCVDGKGGLV